MFIFIFIIFCCYLISKNLTNKWFDIKYIFKDFFRFKDSNLALKCYTTVGIKNGENTQDCTLLGPNFQCAVYFIY